MRQAVVGLNRRTDIHTRRTLGWWPQAVKRKSGTSTQSIFRSHPCAGPPFFCPHLFLVLSSFVPFRGHSAAAQPGKGKLFFTFFSVSYLNAPFSDPFT